MYQTTSVFDVIAAEDTDHRVSSRRALALAHTRVENRLGAYLQQAVTETEFNARLASIQDDLNTHVAEACEECGHDHPEHIAASLVNHFKRTRRWQPRGAAVVTSAECRDCGKDMNPVDAMVGGADKGSPICQSCTKKNQKSVTGGENPFAKKDEDELDDVDDADDKKDGDDKEEKDSKPPWLKDKKSAQGKQSAPLGSKQGGPEGFSRFAPSADNPFARMQQEAQGMGITPHIPNEVDPVVKRDPMYSKTADMGFDPSLQHDKEAEDICPACGGGGTSNSGHVCPHCGGHGYVAGYGNSVLDAVAKVADSGNTDLGGPEPKMDKAKWTPKSLDQRPGEESGGMWPTKEKDIIEPIPAHNRDQEGHDLVEIGEQTTEHVDLPAAGDTEHGYYDGGEVKGPTSWQKAPSQATPVTHEVQ